MKKILHCLQDLNSGGVEQRRLLIAQKLQTNKYYQFEHKIICTKASDFFIEEFKKVNVEVEQIGHPKHIFDIAWYKKGLNIAKSFNPDIIHGAVFEGVALAAIVGRLAKVKSIVTEETSDPKNRSWRGNILCRFLMGLSHKVIAISPSVKDYLINVIYLPKSKVKLITNGVRNHIKSQPDELLLLKSNYDLEECIVIGFVCRLLNSHKGISYLLEAFSQLPDMNINIKLLIVGDGPDKDKLITLTEKIGIRKKVVFTGHQAETSKFFDLMDVFCLPSNYEGFGLVVAEAMMAKIPVVATKVGGIPGIIQDNLSGYLVSPRNPVELSKKLTILLYDEKLRKNLGEEGYNIACSKFTEDRYINDLSSFYNGLLRK